jgi:hypothetical protein
MAGHDLLEIRVLFLSAVFLSSLSFSFLPWTLPPCWRQGQKGHEADLEEKSPKIRYSAETNLFCE